MTHSRSGPYQFQIAVNGVYYPSVFVIIDNRLITVTAAGRKRTEELGMMPPLALAEYLAGELVREQLARAAAVAAHPHPEDEPEPHSHIADDPEAAVKPAPTSEFHEVHQSWFSKHLLRWVGGPPAHHHPRT
ncbi:acyl transferase [Rhodopseudomonas palustris]|uniref:acyl transferase n=1 Tax=Rhodopseudomonas palustris TaxID=1076 RepID=UPI0021F2942F|nr:acyl transferase [Rhodopseudomonas palustris]UYO44250.1 acyl transferase [Rhodopseudomonas palustris]